MRWLHRYLTEGSTRPIQCFASHLRIEERGLEVGGLS